MSYPEGSSSRMITVRDVEIALDRIRDSIYLSRGK
jgi:hypothetical protein